MRYTIKVCFFFRVSRLSTSMYFQSLGSTYDRNSFLNCVSRHVKVETPACTYVFVTEVSLDE